MFMVNREVYGRGKLESPVETSQSVNCFSVAEFAVGMAAVGDLTEALIYNSFTGELG